MNSKKKKSTGQKRPQRETGDLSFADTAEKNEIETKCKFCAVARECQIDYTLLQTAPYISSVHSIHHTI